MKREASGARNVAQRGLGAPLDHLLGDDVWTKVNIEFYRDAQDGVFKVLE